MNLPRRRLGRTELNVSEIGMGGAWLRGPAHTGSISDGVSLVRTALDRGITYVDTAECYLDGVSEQIVGAALVDRSDVVVSTKFGHVPAAFDFTRQSVLASVAASLERLQRPSVDVLFLHAPPEPTWDQVADPGGALDGMREARERGWASHLAVSGYDVAFLDKAVGSDAFDVMLVFGLYDLLDQRGEHLLRRAADHDMGVVIGSPLRGGFLTPSRQALFADDTMDEPATAFLTEIDGLFVDEPSAAVGGALRFLLANRAVSTVLIGGATQADVDQAVAIAGLPLTSMQATRIADLQERYHAERG